MTSSRPSPAALAMRRYRGRHPEYADRENRRATARQRAFDALARQHPAEFARLLEAALAGAGVTDPGLERPCACGGTITRSTPRGRWPAACGTCKAKSPGAKA